MAKPKDNASDAGKQYAEIWGETIHSNRHLRVFTIVLGVLLLCVTIVVVRLSSVEPPRPIVVRVDEVGRAEALAYETVEAQADPRDPTTKYFLNRFLHDHFGRRRPTAQQYWPRSLRFLSTDLANAAFTASNEEIALLAAGITPEELRVENVVLRIQANPTEPQGAVADFALIRTRQEREVSREAWTATVQFVFMPVIPADLVIFNPMGIQITYLETDQNPDHERDAMIAHLRERGKALEPFGWSQQDAEWVAMVCLHSGVFTRSQYTAYFHAHHSRAQRFVQTLVDMKLAVEEPIPVIRRMDRTQACRITHKGIYRELGVPNIRHRRFADPGAYLRRLLSLDYVIEHPELEWLPTEEEKVFYCTGVGVPKNQLPKRIYTGSAGSVARYFHLKLPIAGGPATTFVYVDPGQQHLHRTPELGLGAPACLECHAGTGHQDSSDRNRNQSRRR